MAAKQNRVKTTNFELRRSVRCLFVAKVEKYWPVGQYPDSSSCRSNAGTADNNRCQDNEFPRLKIANEIGCLVHRNQECSSTSDTASN